MQEYVTKHQRDLNKAVAGFPFENTTPEAFDVAVGGPIDDKLLKVFFGLTRKLHDTNAINNPKLQNFSSVDGFMGDGTPYWGGTPESWPNAYEKPVLKEPAKPKPPKLSDEAVKFDGGKIDWTLVPFDGLEEMVRVLEFGAKKYARNNWQSNGGFNHTRILNSLMRHLFAYSAGEDLDPESGISHIGHAQCNLLFLAHYLKHPEKFTKDDRFKG